MKPTLIQLALISMLALSGCDKAPEQSAAIPVESTRPATAETEGGENLLSKAKDLGQEGWDKTKEVTQDTVNAVSEKSKEYYDSAKEQATAVGGELKDQVQAAGEAIGDKSSEIYESAKEKGSELINEVAPKE